ncbi:MAG: TRAP transporter large permease [Rhodospirillaceae bacterium]|nr:TRAP transporter large permease [Rhodospirillaceae bacterium]
MEWYEAGALLLGLALVPLALGAPVFISFLFANAIGVLIFMGGANGLIQLVSNGTVSISSFLLVPVPLFILMGEIFFHAGLAVRVFDALDAVFGGIRGRLSYLCVTSGTVFATLTGTSMASTAMMGSMLVPEMNRRGYKSKMSIGPILGSGGLAMIIPPSALAVLLGSLAQIDIGALLLAGIVPGLVLALLYIGLIYLQVRLDPNAAPIYETEHHPLGHKLMLLATNVLPMGLVIFAVIGMIIAGIATPSESAAFGVIGVVILAIVFRRLNWEVLKKSLTGTVKVTVMVFMIIVGSSTFSQLLAFSGASSGLVSWATDLAVDPVAMLLLMFLVLLFLGMFLDQVSQMLLTLPVFMPLAVTLGYDPIWFGVVMLLAMEISLTTPPFGLLLFVMLGVAPKGTTLSEVALASVPYILCSLILLALLILVPGIAVGLPDLIR